MELRALGKSSTDTNVIESSELDDYLNFNVDKSSNNSAGDKGVGLLGLGSINALTK